MLFLKASLLLSFTSEFSVTNSVSRLCDWQLSCYRYNLTLPERRYEIESFALDDSVGLTILGTMPCQGTGCDFVLCRCVFSSSVLLHTKAREQTGWTCRYPSMKYTERIANNEAGNIQLQAENNISAWYLEFIINKLRRIRGLSGVVAVGLTATIKRHLPDSTKTCSPLCLCICMYIFIFMEDHSSFSS